jgi:hypothetical protein
MTQTITMRLRCVRVSAERRATLIRHAWLGLAFTIVLFAPALLAAPTATPESAVGLKADNPINEEEKSLERFFHRILDLSKPELAEIREQVEKQNLASAAELYQRRFIGNLSRLDLGAPWVYYTANSAADLMADTVKWKKGGGRIE